MYNSQINNFINNLISQAENHTDCLKNIISCLKGYFAAPQESENENVKSVLKLPQKEKDTLKLQNKTIFKNKYCNTWYTRYRENGVQHYISGKSQKEVYAKLKKQLNIQEKDTSKNITLIKWYEKWVALFKTSVKQTTIVDYEKSLKNIDNKILNKALKNITAFEVLENLNRIDKERTRQKVYELLKALFEKAYNLDIIKNNIIKQIDKPKHKREEGIALTKAEQKRFIEYCNTYIYGDLFLVTMYQGLRVGEVLALTGNDIDIKNKKLSINKSINRSNKFDSTKNTQSERNMPIFDTALPILQKYQDYKTKRLFNYTYSVPQKHLKKIAVACNLRDISPHDLRHTFVTNCKLKNIPEHIIQSWIGHKIGSLVTSTVYTHSNEEDTTEFIDKMNV